MFVNKYKLLDYKYYKCANVANWQSHFALNKHEILTSAVLKLHRRYLMAMSFTWPPPVLVCVRATDSPGSIDKDFGHFANNLMMSACTYIILHSPIAIPINIKLGPNLYPDSQCEVETKISNTIHFQVILLNSIWEVLYLVTIINECDFHSELQTGVESTI